MFFQRCVGLFLLLKVSLPHIIGVYMWLFTHIIYPYGSITFIFQCQTIESGHFVLFIIKVWLVGIQVSDSELHAMLPEINDYAGDDEAAREMARLSEWKNNV